MGDHIFPVCPDCGNKASGGEGVSLQQLIDGQGKFEWICTHCRTVWTGEFHPFDSDITWHGSRPTLYRSIVERLKRWWER